MNTKTTKVALTKPLKVFKSIRVRKLLHENGKGSLVIKTREVTGHLNYVRFYYEGYDYKAGDDLDMRILEKAKATFINAAIVINELIVLEGQLEDYISRTRGNIYQNVMTSIVPSFAYEEIESLVGKQFTQYKFVLKLNLQTSWDQLPIEKADVFQEFFDISIDHKVYDKLGKSIQQV